MEEKLRKIWRNKYFTFGHLFFDALLILYSVMYIFDGDSVHISKYCILIGIVLFCVLLEVLDWKMQKSILEESWIGKVYYVIRPVVSIAYCLLCETKLEANIYIALIIYSMAELILHVCISSQMQRIVAYLLFALSYGIVSVIMLVSLVQDKSSRVTVPIGIREISVVTIVLFIVVFFGESIAALWNCFERQIFKQNRVLDELNSANVVLQEQQEKINRVNEKLGMQKIELQAANKRINRSHDEMSVQNEISSVIASSIGKEEMLNQIACIMQIRLDMDVVAIILEEDNSLLVPGEEPKGRFVAISSCLGKDFKEQLLKSAYTTDMRELLAMTQTYVQNCTTDSAKLFRCMEEDKELTSIICIPVVSQDVRFGTLIIGKNKVNTFMDGRAFYENIASQISIGIYNARLYSKMKDMAIRDGLTRIYNRRYLTEILSDYLNEAVQKKMSVSLALFDIDKFKMINDSYGHQCGDEVIRYVATLLNKGAMKHGGIAGRYGGEEFVVAFLDKDIDETYAIVKEIHDQIRSEDVVYEDKHVQVRASAGVASYPATCSNPSELLTRADWAMYHSKRNGRDQITIDSNLIEDKM